MRNQITPDTVNLPLGDIDKGFCVMEVKLRTTAHEKEILTTLAKIPQNIIFAVTFEDKTEYTVFYKGKLYKTLPVGRQGDTAAASLSVDIATVCEDLQAQIIGVTVTENTLSVGRQVETAVLQAEKREQLQRKIAALEKRIKNEKQFNIQIELNKELKLLKEELL
jgi:hypothetical protein